MDEEPETKSKNNHGSKNRHEKPKNNDARYGRRKKEYLKRKVVWFVISCIGLLCRSLRLMTAPSKVLSEMMLSRENARVWEAEV